MHGKRGAWRDDGGGGAQREQALRRERAQAVGGERHASARPGELRGGGRGVRGDHGPVWFGKVNASELPRHHRRAFERPDRHRRSDGHRPARTAAQRLQARRPRVHLPGREPARHAHGLREHRARAHHPARFRARDRRTRARGGARPRHRGRAGQAALPDVGRPAAARGRRARHGDAPAPRAGRRADGRTRLPVGGRAARIARIAQRARSHHPHGHARCGVGELLRTRHLHQGRPPLRGAAPSRRGPAGVSPPHRRGDGQHER